MKLTRVFMLVSAFAFAVASAFATSLTSNNALLNDACDIEGEFIGLVDESCIEDESDPCFTEESEPAYSCVEVGNRLEKP